MRVGDLEIDLKLIVDDMLHGEIDAGVIHENSEIRAEYLCETPLLTAQEIRDQSGRRRDNKSGQALRWKREKKVFAVCYGGIDLYPAFQFEDGVPKPIIRKILAILPDDMSDWQIAFWFDTGNGWLKGTEPQNCLSQTEEVFYAAQQIAEPAFG